MRPRRLRKFILLALAVACAPEPATLSDEDRAVIAESVDSATRAFEAAQRDRNAERAIEHLAPEFFMRVDGVRMSYDSVAASIRRTIPAYRHLEPGFSDLTVGVLGPHTAFVSFVFRDSAVAASGEVHMSTGPTTFIWERRNGRWLIVYADADHRSSP